MDAVVCESDAMRAWAVCAMLVLSTAVPARGQDVVYFQSPDRGFGYTSDTEFYYSAGKPSSALQADDFRLNQNEIICGLNWWAFFGGDPDNFGSIDPPATETLRVRFYADAAGLPGGVLAEQAFVDPSRTATGYRVAIAPLRPEYLYSVSLSPCFTAAANTTYWLEVAQLDNIDSRFRWEESLQSTSFAFQFPIGVPWRRQNGEGLAFELRQSPEPTVSTLLLLTCFSFAMRSSRRPTKNR